MCANNLHTHLQPDTRKNMGKLDIRYVPSPSYSDTIFKESVGSIVTAFTNIGEGTMYLYIAMGMSEYFLKNLGFKPK